MLEWKPQAFPDTFQLSQPNISHDSHCFSIALASSCYASGHISLVLLIGRWELYDIKMEQRKNCWKNVISVWFISLLYDNNTQNGEYQLITHVINRSWELIFWGKWMCNSKKYPWVEKTIIFPLRLIYCDKKQSHPKQTRTAVSLFNQKLQKDYSQKEKKAIEAIE